MEEDRNSENKIGKREEEKACEMVFVKNMGREGRRTGRKNPKNCSVLYISGMFCDLSGTAMEKTAEEFCPCEAGVSRICFHYFESAGGFIFLFVKGSGHGETDDR